MICIKLIAALCFILSMSGCAGMMNYNSQASEFYKNYVIGNTQVAVQKVSAMAEKRAGSKDELLWRLEQGAVCLADGNFDASLAAFKKAEELLRKYDDELFSVSGEAGALLVNQRTLPYRGTMYDRIMVNTYKALAFMRQGDMEAAIVEFRRAYSRQQEAVEKYGKYIEKQKAEANRKGVSYQKMEKQSEYKEAEKRAFKDFQKYQAYGDYVNPLTVYLDGLVHLAKSTGGSDLERARKNFERVKGMTGGSPLLDADIAMVADRYANKQSAPVVYVIMENGMAPIRREHKIDLPVPVKGRLIAVSIAFPVLDFQVMPYEKFQVKGSESNNLGESIVLSSMEGIIAQEFKHHFPAIMTRTITSAAIKAYAQYELQRQSNDHPAALVGGLLYTVLTNNADLRTWLTLPKEFLFTRFERPANGKIQLTDSRGQTIMKLDLPEAEMLLVYLKTPSRGTVSTQVIKLR